MLLRELLRNKNNKINFSMVHLVHFQVFVTHGKSDFEYFEFVSGPHVPFGQEDRSWTADRSQDRGQRPLQLLHCTIAFSDDSTCVFKPC